MIQNSNLSPQKSLFNSYACLNAADEFFQRKIHEVASPILIYRTQYGLYEGQAVDGKFNGRGVFIYKNKSYYVGEWKDHRMNGIGKHVNSDGNTYEGEFVNGARNGFGKMIFKSGDVYEGTWKNDIIEGQGKYTASNGAVYEGAFIKGRREGFGKFVFNGFVYEGDWKNHQFNGYGKIQYTNGDFYEGEVKNGTKNGKGKMTYRNGLVFEGVWKKGKRYKGLIKGPDNLARPFDLEAIKRKETSSDRYFDRVNLRKHVLKKSHLKQQQLAKNEKN